MPTSPVLPKAYEMDQVLKSRRAQRAVLLPIFKKKIARCPEAEAPGQESRDLSEQKKKDGFEVKRPLPSSRPCTQGTVPNPFVSFTIQ
jgi:hypothetical protein